MREEKKRSLWIAPIGLSLFFVVLFVRDTIPAWSKASQLREERDRLYAENVSKQEELRQYRVEKENLLNNYFYNERIRRLLFQTGPQQPNPK